MTLSNSSEAVFLPLHRRGPGGGPIAASRLSAVCRLPFLHCPLPTAYCLLNRLPTSTNKSSLSPSTHHPIQTAIPSTTGSFSSPLFLRKCSFVQRSVYR